MWTLLLALFAQGRIEGSVVDAAGAPVAGARVIAGELGHATLYYTTPADMFPATPGLQDAEAQRYSAVVTSDASGRFAIADLEPGEYSLIAADAARGIAFTTQRLDASAPMTAKLVLASPATISGRVRGLRFDSTVHVLELKPLDPRANITMVPRLVQEDGRWDFASVALPSVGVWRLVGTEVVLEQDYRATLFATTTRAEPGHAAALTIDLEGGASLSGRVLDDDGAPAALVNVVASFGPAAVSELGAISDVEGRFTIRGLVPGTWRIEASRWGVRELPGCGNGPQELAGSTSVRIDASEPPADIELRVHKRGSAPAVGERAPDFQATTIDERRIKLSELRGKFVLVDFWATWCGMCRADLPRLLAAYERFAPDGRFEIVGVSVDEDPALVGRFTSSRGVRWPQLALGPAAKNAVAQLYNVNSTPSTVLIAPDGKILALNLTGEALRKKLDELLAPK